MLFYFHVSFPFAQPADFIHHRFGSFELPLLLATMSFPYQQFHLIGYLWQHLAKHSHAITSFYTTTMQS